MQSWDIWKDGLACCTSQNPAELKPIEYYLKGSLPVSIDRNTASHVVEKTTIEKTTIEKTAKMVFGGMKKGKDAACYRFDPFSPKRL
jgi:hypothetical protein